MNTTIFKIVFLNSIIRGLMITFLSVGIGFITSDMSSMIGLPENQKIAVVTICILLIFYSFQFNNLETFFKRSEIKLFWVVIVTLPIPVVSFLIPSPLALLITMFLISVITSYQSRFVFWKNEALKRAMAGTTPSQRKPE